MLTLTNTPLASRAWRLRNLYSIFDAEGKLVPFVPNEAQRTFYRRMWYCNHVLKARKLGFSTFIEILFADDLLFSPTPLTAGIIDYTIEDAESKLAMLKTCWEHLDNGDIHPETWQLGRTIKKAIPLLRQAARSLEFGNGSKAKCATSLRGTTPQRIHVSELGKTAIWAPIKAREIINGAFNSMTPGNVRNIESTHEGGQAGEHYRLLRTAMRHDDANLSTIQSRFHFFPWYQDARYVLPHRGRIRPETLKYFERLRADLPGVTFTPEQIQWYDDKSEEQGHGMKKEFPTTPGEAFQAIAEGAIYGTEMANLRAAGRITDFGLEQHLPLYSFWDLGLSDYTAIWLIQPVGRALLVLDWAEFEGIPGSAMPDKMLLWERKWGKPIARHFLPHDANTRDRTNGKSYAQTLKDGKIGELVIVPRTPDVWLGIGYVRDVLPHCWFHKTHCDTPRNRDGTPHAENDSQEEFPSGIACLEGYQKDLSPSATKIREMPKHDLFSHSADAFRTFAEAWRLGLVNPESSHQPKAIGPQARRR